MKGSMTREQGLRMTSYVLLMLVILAGAYAWMEHGRANDAEAALAQARKASDDAAAANAKASTQLKAASAKVTELEQKQHELDSYKALFAKVEPDVVPVLEAAGRTGRPGTRSAALTTAGLIGQLAHGPNHEPALSALDRAIVAGSENCAAILALNLGGKKVDVPAQCQPEASAAPAAAAGAPASKPPAPAPAAAAKAPEPAKK